MAAQITVRVPASTSNLGPGFDCLGVALQIYNEVTVRRGASLHNESMAKAAAEMFFRETTRAPFPFSAQVKGDVPISRGLGSSVTVRLGVLHGLNALADAKLSRERIFQLCAELEGHPDNAGPAEFGGFHVIRARQRQRFAVSSALKYILLIPDFEMQTVTARALLPDRILRTAAVESCGNACAITAAFSSGKYKNLRGAFGDQLHQPFRKKLLPFFDEVVKAAEKAGALGAFLSGSGSTIAAVTLSNAPGIAAAMRAAAFNCRVIITTADNRGTRVFSR